MNGIEKPIKYGKDDSFDYRTAQVEATDQYIFMVNAVYFVGPDGNVWMCYEFTQNGQPEWGMSENLLLADLDLNAADSVEKLPKEVAEFGWSVARALLAIRGAKYPY